MATNARIINMFTCIAVSLLRRPESIDTPCSVKTYGRYRSPPLDFEMPFWHFKDFAHASAKFAGIRLLNQAINRSSIAKMTIYFHPLMENTDDKNVSIGEWSIENEMVTGPESVKVLRDVTI